MKTHNTQRLFWKQWPYKAIVRIEPSNDSMLGWRRLSNDERAQRHAEFKRIERWCKARFPDAGIRKETHMSIFLNTEQELDDLVDSLDSLVLEVWKPQNESAKDLLLAHSYDVVRENPWYGKYPIRARICYNDDFRTKYVQTLKDAVLSLEDEWHAAGLLKNIIEKQVLPRVYGWGQPLHLYLASADDAAMLRLTCGDCIDRFERIRKP